MQPIFLSFLLSRLPKTSSLPNSFTTVRRTSYPASGTNTHSLSRNHLPLARGSYQHDLLIWRSLLILAAYFPLLFYCCAEIRCSAFCPRPPPICRAELAMSIQFFFPLRLFIDVLRIFLRLLYHRSLLFYNSLQIVNNIHNMPDIFSVYLSLSFGSRTGA